ncbi:hypothetical protein K469DRAFT_805689 [Zopfia rhizophila CBS 207.26]|uniref:HTH psq-type domain-containing protein n=1 Tax=Zopfia rhizophila CBS 207.26 TaxID=1314779 RepID=A0A6A6DG07_9PEZI|nr:hypothetical protein K469DRAFT_805689 [Zopfia rhizophila CBS 207.26]
MSDTYQDIETRIQDAIHTIQSQENPNISDTARQFSVPRQRLYPCWHGRPVKSNLLGPNHRFSIKEERALCCYLNRLDQIGFPA